LVTSELLANARLALPSGELRAGWLRVQDGRIAALGEGAVDGPARDLGGAVLAPGFVDVHVHGAAGAEFLDADDEGRAAILRAHARGGTTALLATTVTASRERLRAAVDALAAAEPVAGGAGLFVISP
jgi:N-acetylglucosamine-6-phosphate deacetylase